MVAMALILTEPGLTAAYYSAHPELVEGWQTVTGGTAAAAGRQLISVEPATGGEGGV